MSSMSPEQVIELKHSLDNMAELLKEYYDRLKAEGFDSGEALKIVIGWQRSVLQGNSGDE